MYGITGTAYQIAACDTAIFPKNKAMEYLTLGLTGEAGEIANKVKKFIRDGAPQDEYEAKGYRLPTRLVMSCGTALCLPKNLTWIWATSWRRI